jgi:hypothetical protein
MGATRRNLRAQAKILKNVLNTKTTNQNEKFSKKKYVKFLKSKKEPKIRMGVTRRSSPREPKKQ